jgi:hypothetical protein
MRITEAARSKAWTVFARSNTERGMGVCVRLFCVCVVVSVGSDIVMGWSPVQGVLPTVYYINSLALASWRTISTERPPHVVELSANFYRVVSATDPYGRVFGFLDRSRYLFQVAPQLYSRGWVDPVPDPLLRKSSSAGNATRTSGSVQELWPLDHRGGHFFLNNI